MSKRKVQQEESEGLCKKSSPGPSEYSVTTKPTATNAAANECVLIGSRIRPQNISKTTCQGTAGPFVRIKETNELCFLTVRHIFGPYRTPEKFIGTKVVREVEDQILVCGEVIAFELSETLDVVLVKIEDNNTSPRFINISEDQLKTAELTTFSSYYNVKKPIDVRNLTSTEAKSYRLVIIGSSSGLILGRFNFRDEKILLDDVDVSKNNDMEKMFQIRRYKKQIHIISLVNCELEADVGAAVFLVDQSNHLHCIGMVCCIQENNKGILVTPIQVILEQLGQDLCKTLEVETFEFNEHPLSLDTKDMKPFQLALSQGEENDRQLRVNIVGFFNEGKTTLTKRLLGEPIDDIECTDGIDVHIHKSKIKGKQWTKYEPKTADEEYSRRLSDIIKSGAVDTADVKVEQHQDEKGVNINPQASDVISSPSVDTDNPSDSSVRKPVTMTTIKSKKLLKLFSIQLKVKDKILNDDEMLATVWDFGGQFIYYSTHQIFHSKDAIYLLVFDLSKNLEDCTIDRDFPGRKEKLKTSLRFWANSIIAFVGEKKGNGQAEPTIILVGTHKDDLKGGNDEINEKFGQVIDLLSETPAGDHIYEKPFAVSNTDMNDPVIEDLKLTIYNIGLRNAAGKKLPAKWIPLEAALMEVKNKDKSILTFTEVMDLDAANDYPVGDEFQLKRFLKYHHEKGTLVYFDEHILDKFVIVNPQYLINAFRCIISSKWYCRWNSRLNPKWKKLTKSAIIEKEFLLEVWNTDEHNDFTNHTKELILFLERHRILAEILELEKDGNTYGQNRYMIPNMLKDCCDNSMKDFLKGKPATYVIFGIALKNDIVKEIVYEKVTAAAIGKWAPLEIQKNKPLVFQNVGCYLLDKRHTGKIEKTDNGIELMVVNLCKQKVDCVVCEKFRKYIEHIIAHELGKHHAEKREEDYREYIKCNDVEHGEKGTNRYHYLNDLSETDESVFCPDFGKNPIDIRKARLEWFHTCVRHEKKIDPSRKVTTIELSKIASAIGENWNLLGVDLELSTEVIERIKMDQSSTATAIFYMLSEWKNRSEQPATLCCLINTMKNCNALHVDWEQLDKFFS